MRDHRRLRHFIENERARATFWESVAAGKPLSKRTVRQGLFSVLGTARPRPISVERLTAALNGRPTTTVPPRVPAPSEPLTVIVENPSPHRLPFAFERGAMLYQRILEPGARLAIVVEAPPERAAWWEPGREILVRPGHGTESLVIHSLRRGSIEYLAGPCSAIYFAPHPAELEAHERTLRKPYDDLKEMVFVYQEGKRTREGSA